MDNKELVILAGKPAGGGGGGSDSTFKVTFEVSYNPLTISCDKTLEEISEAFFAGKLVYTTVEDRTYLLESIDLGDEVADFVAVNGPSVFKIYMPIWSDDWMMDSYLIAPKPSVDYVSGATPTISPVPDTDYKCGTLTSLTITDPPATGAYSIVFTSGATATTTTIPATILGLEDFSAESNTVYEINVLDNRAVIGKWAVS